MAEQIKTAVILLRMKRMFRKYTGSRANVVIFNKATFDRVPKRIFGMKATTEWLPEHEDIIVRQAPRHESE